MYAQQYVLLFLKQSQCATEYVNQVQMKTNVVMVKSVCSDVANMRMYVRASVYVQGFTSIHEAVLSSRKSLWLVQRQHVGYCNKSGMAMS